MPNRIITELLTESTVADSFLQMHPEDFSQFGFSFGFKVQLVKNRFNTDWEAFAEGNGQAEDYTHVFLPHMLIYTWVQIVLHEVNIIMCHSDF